MLNLKIGEVYAYRDSNYGYAGAVKILDFVNCDNENFAKCQVVEIWNDTQYRAMDYAMTYDQPVMINMKDISEI